MKIGLIKMFYLNDARLIVMQKKFLYQIFFKRYIFYEKYCQTMKEVQVKGVKITKEKRKYRGRKSIEVDLVQFE